MIEFILNFIQAGETTAELNQLILSAHQTEMLQCVTLGDDITRELPKTIKDHFEHKEDGPYLYCFKTESSQLIARVNLAGFYEEDLDITNNTFRAVEETLKFIKREYGEFTIYVRADDKDLFLVISENYLKAE